MAIPKWLIVFGIKRLWNWFLKKERDGSMRGVKTSEFWVTIATAIAALLTKWMGEEFPTEAMATAIAYVLGRAAVKLKK